MKERFMNTWGYLKAKWFEKDRPVRIVVSALLALAFLSMTVGGAVASRPGTYSNSISVLDRQKEKAMGLSAVVTIAATAVSAAPDDIASPIADELSELSTPILLAIAVLYLEKYLLTTMGWASFTFMMPGACIFAVLHLWFGKEKFQVWCKKCLILGLALLLLVPVSVKITTMIENTFAQSMEETMNQVARLTEKEEAKEEQNAFVAFFASIKDNVVMVLESAKEMLSVMVDAVAILIVTSCLIPLLTAVVFIWIVKLMLGSSIVNASTELPALLKDRRIAAAPQERLTAESAEE